MEINGERLEPFKPPFSVLELIKNTVAPEELSVVHSYLGESTVEYCTDLRNELETLLEIWKEVGERTEMPTVSKPLTSNPLPDPPLIREMLTKEIQILVKGIQEKNNLNCEQSLYEEQDVLNYVINSHHTQHNYDRPVTPVRKVNCETSYTTSPVKLKHVRRNINAVDIDNVASILKEAMQKECKALEHDIEFLQKCIEEEHDLVASRPATPMQEPSITKLKEVKKLLENQILPDLVALKSHQCSDKSVYHNIPARVTRKNITPPSPTRILLKPIPSLVSNTSLQKFSSAPSSPSTWRPSTGKPFNAECSPVQPPRAASAMDYHKTNISPTECWVEPSWTENMSQSLPSTADSGVCSRPATCDLVAIQDRMRSLELKSGGDSFEPSTQHPSNDDGYATSSSADLNAYPKSISSEVKPTASHASKILSQNCIKENGGRNVKIIKPRPPQIKVQGVNRRNINLHRFSKKAITVADDPKIGGRS